MDFDNLTAVMRRLALEAGEKIMEIYRSDDFDVQVKSDDSPVTAADEAADAVISAGLREAFPDTPLVTEEQADSHDETAMTFLIVDPLDGTKEFIKRRGDFTVNIAYVSDGVPVRGRGLRTRQGPAVLYYGHRPVGRGTGPFDLTEPGETTPIHVSEPDIPS